MSRGDSRGKKTGGGDGGSPAGAGGGDATLLQMTIDTFPEAYCSGSRSDRCITRKNVCLSA